MSNSQTEREALQAAKPGRQRTSQQGRRLRYEGTRFQCPHCKASSEIRTGRMVSDTMREAIYACTNVECGHTFVVLSEVARTLSPSATPDPTVNRPLSTHVRRDMMRATLDHAASAAHTPQFTRPVTGDLFAVGGSPPD